MEEGHALEACSPSAGKEVPRFLCDTNVHIVISYFFKLHFSIILLFESSDILSSGSLIKIFQA